MINIATLCDKKYILKGLAMRQSLIDLGVEYKIYWLCLDDETYDTASRLEGVVPFNISYFSKDIDLQTIKSNPETKYGSQRDNYIWSLAPFFVNFLLRSGKGDIVYVDSDIFFYESPKIILDYIGDKSIGIHTHRFGPNRKKLDVGWYNVGVVYLKSDRVGMLTSDLWKHWVIDTSSPYYEEYGTCGDQKFLELFPYMFPNNVCVFDEGEISHRAPWCCDEDNKKVHFFHFSHFNCNLEQNSWTDSNHGEWKPSKHPHIKPYYEQYFEKIKQVSKLL